MWVLGGLRLFRAFTGCRLLQAGAHSCSHAEGRCKEGAWGGVGWGGMLGCRSSLPCMCSHLPASVWCAQALLGLFTVLTAPEGVSFGGRRGGTQTPSVQASEHLAGPCVCCFSTPAAGWLRDPDHPGSCFWANVGWEQVRQVRVGLDFRV